MCEIITINNTSIPFKDYLKPLPSAYRAMSAGLIMGLSPDIKLQILDEKEAGLYWDSHYAAVVEQSLLPIKQTLAINASLVNTIAKNVFIQRNTVTVMIYVGVFLSNEGAAYIERQFPWFNEGLVSLLYDCVYKLSNNGKITLLDLYTNYYQNPVNNVKLIESVIINSAIPNKPRITDMDNLIRYILNFSCCLFDSDMFYRNYAIRYQDYPITIFLDEILRNVIFPYKDANPYREIVLESASHYFWTVLEQGKKEEQPTEVIEDVVIDYYAIEELKHNKFLSDLESELKLSVEQLNYRYDYLTKLSLTLEALENNESPQFSLEELKTNDYSLESLSDVIAITIEFLKQHIGKIITIVFTIIITLITRWVAFRDKEEAESSSESSSSSTSSSEKESTSPTFSIDPEIKKEEEEKLNKTIYEFGLKIGKYFNNELSERLLVTHEYSEENLLATFVGYSQLAENILTNIKNIAQETRNFFNHDLTEDTANTIVKKLVDYKHEYDYKNLIELINYASAQYHVLQPPKDTPIYKALNNACQSNKFSFNARNFAASDNNSYFTNLEVKKEIMKDKPLPYFPLYSWGFFIEKESLTKMNERDLNSWIERKVKEGATIKPVELSKINTARNNINTTYTKATKVSKVIASEFEKVQTLYNKISTEKETVKTWGTISKLQFKGELKKNEDDHVTLPSFKQSITGNEITPVVKTIYVYQMRRDLIKFALIQKKLTILLDIKNVILDLNVVLSTFKNITHAEKMYSNFKSKETKKTQEAIVSRSKQKQGVK